MDVTCETLEFYTVEYGVEINLPDIVLSEEKLDFSIVPLNQASLSYYCCLEGDDVAGKVQIFFHRKLITGAKLSHRIKYTSTGRHSIDEALSAVQ